MRRDPIDDGPGAVFHVSARVNWRRFLFSPEARRDLVRRMLRAACETYGVEILAYVVMSNHFHAVLRSPSARLFATLTSRRTASRHRRPYPQGHPNASVIAQCMRYFMRAVSGEVQKELGTSGRLWDRGYFARLIQSDGDLTTAIAYNHLNPLKQDMVERAEDYVWSSARNWRDGGSQLWPGHGYRELPFDLERRELVERLRSREARGPLHEVLREMEEEGIDWAAPGAYDEVLARLRSTECGTRSP